MKTSHVKGLANHRSLPLFTERIVDRKGIKYVTIKVSTTGKRWPYKHRWVMEQHLGRKLEKCELVHHIDENTLNNDLSNLKLLHIGCHVQLHFTIERWSKKYDACISCKTTDRPHRGKGLCVNCYVRINKPRMVARKTRWSIKYEHCITCGRSDRPYHSHGLCEACAARKRRTAK